MSAALGVPSLCLSFPLCKLRKMTIILTKSLGTLSGLPRLLGIPLQLGGQFPISHLKHLAFVSRGQTACQGGGPQLW